MQNDQPPRRSWRRKRQMLERFPFGATKLQDLVVEGRIISRKIGKIRVYDENSAEALINGGGGSEPDLVLGQIAAIVTDRSIEPEKAIGAIRKVLAKVEQPPPQLYHSGRSKALRRVARTLETKAPTQ
jgi:hypothetical protein